MTRVFADPEPILDEVELIILAVPDDVVAGLAGSLRMYSGQAMIHTSGALGAEVLAPAMAAGTQIGAFHPLVAFADTERAVAALHGATVAIEGDDQLAAMLADMAEAIGATPVRLAPGSKAAYHAAAVLAAGGFVALLDAIAELGRVAGLDERGSLAIYGPLIEGTLGNARALGIRAALTGPMTRGDVGTLEAHLETLRRHAPGVLDLYVAAARREVDLAEERGALAPEDATKMRGRCSLGLASRARTGTIASHGSQHRGQVRGPPGGPIRPPLDSRAASVDWDFGRPARSGPAALRTTVLRGPGGRRARPSAGQLARDPARRLATPANWPAAASR